jgi:lysophospholipase L1-like esterase
VAGGAMLLFAFFLEAATRFIFAHSLDFSMEMWKYAVQLKRPSSDPEASFVHVPNRSAFLMGVTVSINSFGLRDREFSREKPAGTCRVLMLGDSTTLGWGVPVEQTVAKILERKLNPSSVSGCGRFEVLNGGVGNYGTVQEVAQYRNRDRFFKPDLVILEYFINDAEPVPRERTPGLLGRSYLLAFVASRYDALMRFSGARPAWKEYYASLYRADQPGLRAATRALDRLADMTRQDGLGLLVALLPDLHDINTVYPFVREHDIVKDVLARKGVAAMDLIDSLRGHGPASSLWVTPQDPHPNGKANELIAGQMLPWILEYLVRAASTKTEVQ